MVEVMISHVRLTCAHSRGVQVACHLFSGEKDHMLIEKLQIVFLLFLFFSHYEPEFVVHLFL